MISNALYSLYHTHCIWYLICSVWCHIHYVCYITQWLYLWHQTLCLWHIHLTWHHAQCYDHISIVCLHSHYVWHYTQCILTWYTMYQFYEKKWMYVITASICMTPYEQHMASHALLMTSHHFIYDVKSTISNITSIISDLTYTVSV